MSDPYHFLIVYDHRGGHMKRPVDRFEDPSKATDAYEVAERDFADEPQIEVVLIGSDSLETVKRTHANYFDGTAKLNEYLASI